MNVGILAVDDIGDDGLQGRSAKLLPIDSTAHVAHGLDGVRVTDGNDFTIPQTEARPGGFREGRFIMGDEVRGHLIKRRYDATLAGAQQDAGMRRKALGPTNRAFLVHEHDGFILRIKTDPTTSQLVRSDGSGCQRSVGAHDKSICCPCSGTRQDQPSSSSIRWRKVSDAVGSPCVMNVVRGAFLNPFSHLMISAASAWAESISKFLTAARTGRCWPWILMCSAPATIAAPRVPPAWKPAKRIVFLASGASCLR